MGGRIKRGKEGKEAKIKRDRDNCRYRSALQFIQSPTVSVHGTPLPIGFAFPDRLYFLTRYSTCNRLLETARDYNTNMTISQPPPFHLTELDRHVLSLTDEQFKPHDWEDLKSIIGMSCHDININIHLHTIPTTYTTPN